MRLGIVSLAAALFSFTASAQAPMLSGLAGAQAFALVWQQAGPPSDPDRAIEESNRRHSYHVSRSIADYAAYFGAEFPQALQRLTAADHLMDMGCGEAYFAEAMATREAPPRVSGVTLRISRLRPAHANLRVLVGDIRDIEDRELLGGAGRAAVITDVFGVFSYFRDAGALLRRYFGLLRPGGSIFMFYSDDRTRVQLPNGRSVSMTEFLESPHVQGVRVTRTRGRYEVDAVRLQRDDGALVIPELELVESRPHPDENDPPLRYYRVR